jgi:hypothetical protein
MGESIADKLSVVEFQKGSLIYRYLLLILIPVLIFMLSILRHTG